MIGPHLAKSGIHVIQSSGMVKTGKSTVGSSKVVMGVCLFLYALWICAQPHTVPDLWWQLRIGDGIREAHRIPRHDVFSWSCYGHPLVLHEWGSCLIFAECYRHLGKLSGIWMLGAAVAGLILEGLYLLLLKNKTTPPVIAFFLALMAGRLCAEFFTPRPHLFTFLCLIASLGILNSFRVNSKVSPFGFLGLILIQILWANLHAAAPVFVAICLCFAVGDGLHGLIEAGKNKELSRVYLKNCIIELFCAVASLAAMMVNPYGLGIYRIFLDTVSNKVLPTTSMAAEWQSADFHDSYGRALEAFVFLIGFILTATRKKHNIGDVLALGLLILSAFYAVRNGPILGLAGSLIAAPYAAGAFARLSERYLPLEALGKLLSKRQTLYTQAIALSVSLVFLVGLFQAWNAGLDRAFMLQSVPESACAFIKKEKIPTSLKLYNEYNTGSYLIWRLPNYPVFISTEAFVYFGPVFNTYLQMNQIPFDWRSLMVRYNPQMVLMGTDDIQAHLFLEAPDWALVYADGPLSDTDQSTNLIFIKRSAGTKDLISRCRADCPEVGSTDFKEYLSAR